MNTTKFLFSILLAFLFASCQKEDDQNLQQDEVSQQAVLTEVDVIADSLEERTCKTGAVSASFNNVTAYINCPIGSVNSYGSSYVGSTYVGLKWQCVEYVQRYYATVYKMNIKTAFGNANSFYTSSTHSSIGLEKFANGSTSPQIGDILVSTANTFGHVAIVTGVSASTVSIIDQNFSTSSARTLARSGNKIGGFNTSYPVSGLVRRKVVTPPATPTLKSPATNAVNLTSPIFFSWSSPGATEYRIQIIESTQYKGFNASTGFTGAMAYNANVGNTTSFTWTQAPKGKTFYWIVRASNSGGTSFFTKQAIIKTKA
jgi:hypothetical protein